MQFHQLNLIEPLLRALESEGYTQPTPIQTQAIPHVLTGGDLIGCAQTGTGKTAAFALPILQRLAQSQKSRKHIRALVLSPTRELATQIHESFTTYGKHLSLKSMVIFGGVGQNPQVQAIQRGTDILVATPGRLLDLIGQGVIKLDQLEIFVLDEADRMLDMGFINDVRKVLRQLPAKRQNLLFSATMPLSIQSLAKEFLYNPAHVEVTPQSSTVEKIAQKVFFVDKKDKRALLEHLLADEAAQRVLVFTRTKHGANKLSQQLAKSNIQAGVIHSNKSQTAREQALANFKSSQIRVLVATDIVTRGIDVENVTHVINFDLPNEPESYVHRIGRTARAGESGIAYSFCDAEEYPYLLSIQKTIAQRVPVDYDHPYALAIDVLQTANKKPSSPARKQSSSAPSPDARNNNHRRRRSRPRQQA